MRVFAGLLAICVVAMACTASEKSKSEADVRAIEALMAKYVSGYESKDVENFVNVFTEDAMRMPPNGSTIVGREGIRAYYDEWFKKESLDVSVTPSEIHVWGDSAVAWGTYEATVTSTTDGTSKEDRGKWVNVFKRGADGSWRFHRNIWNSDMPLASQE